ncbi:MAG TPA: AraC family transcriptional regulator [Armatimonadota bacterium]|nr:AraC family transcriptional regulator [Armatimonadota bacterium]
MATMAYGYVWQSQENIVPAIQAAGHFVHPIRVENRRCMNNFWVLDYVISGQSSYRMSPSLPWQERLPHTAHLYPPQTPYWEHVPAQPGLNFETAHLLFTGGECAGLHSFITPNTHYAEFLDTDLQLMGLLHDIARIGQQYGNDGFWLAQSTFHKLLHILQQSTSLQHGKYCITTSTLQQQPSGFIHEVNDYLQNHLAERIALHDIAQHLHISTSSLSHRYRQETGITPMTYLIQQRIAVAKLLLIQGLQLKTIAKLTGFCDEFHLSKTFRHMEGCAPREYLAYTKTSTAKK